MNIIRSSRMGFCAGVRSAVDAVREAVAQGQAEQKPVYTIGPLIHNEMFLEKLECEDGVRIIEHPEDAQPGIAVIRAHGLAKNARKEFQDGGYHLIDGTCRRVLHSQELVRSHAERGWQIILVGNPDHGEVTAIAGEIPNYPELFIVSDSEDIPDQIDVHRQTLVLCQTTFSPVIYAQITAEMEKYYSQSAAQLRIVDTICPSTRNRQQALTELLESVDAVLIIGGAQSANTRRLFELAEASGKPAWHITRPEEIDPEIFSHNRVGITAGASTPDWLVDRITGMLEVGKSNN